MRMVERGRQVHLLPRGEVGEVPLRRREEGDVLLRRGTRGEALPRRRRRDCILKAEYECDLRPR